MKRVRISSTAVPEEEIVRILKSLEMEIDQRGNGVIHVTHSNLPCGYHPGDRPH